MVALAVDDALHLSPYYGEIENCPDRAQGFVGTFNELLLRIKDARLHEGEQLLNGRDYLVLFRVQA